MKSSSVYVRDCSLVKAYAVLLFGGDICVKHKEQTVLVDDWIDFKVPSFLKCISFYGELNFNVQNYII